MTWQLGAFTVLGVALVAGFGWYERVRPDARIVALVATLAAFAALGRIAFAAVPNVKPTTDIVLISGYALGGAPGFAVGALAGLSSNFFFGQGPWTPWQMAGWGVTGMIGAGLAWLAVVWGRRRRAAGPRQSPPLGRWPLAIVCGIVGFAFTTLQDVGDWVTYSDHSALQLGLYVGRGLGFDAIHAAGCVVFALALGPALTRSIQRFARRLQVEWVDSKRRARVSETVAPALALVVVLSALGLHALPARASSGGSSGAAAAYLLRAENPDGGFGAAPGQPSAQLYAGWAALGLASAGHDLQRVGRVMDYIRRGAGSDSDPGSIERTILVARAAGASARSFAGRDLVAALQRRIRANGSIADQVNLTAFAVLALRAAGVTPPAKMTRWLAGQQDRDGGFSFAGAGGSSDVDDTGAALEALAGHAGADRVNARAVAFLRRQQNRDGGFPSAPGSGSNAQSTAWAIQGLDAVGVLQSGFRRGGRRTPTAYLSSLAAPSGLIRYSRGVTQTPVWVTGEALMALEGRPLPLVGPAVAPRRVKSHRATSRTHVIRTASHAAGSDGNHGTVTSSTSPARSIPPAGTPAPRPRRSAPAPSARRHRTAAPAQISPGQLAGAAGVIAAVMLAPVGLG